MIVKSSSNISVAAATPIPFNNVNIACNCDSPCIQSPDVNGITFNEGGLYAVDVNVAGATATTAGNLAIQLYLDGVPISYAVTTHTSSATTDIVGLNINTVIKVPCDRCGCCDSHRLTVVNTGIAANYVSATITVKAGDYCG